METPLIVGAGPTGLAAALFLAAKGISCRVVDQALAPAADSRAQVINPRTLELLEKTGVSEKILTESHPVRRAIFYQGWDPLAKLEIGDLHPRYHLAVLPQARTEELLTEALAGYEIVPERAVKLETFSQNERAIQATLIHAGKTETISAPFLLGADGAHSRVRSVLEIAFDGSSFPEMWPLYDIELNDPLELDAAHISFVKNGLVFLLGIRAGLWRVFANIPAPLAYLPPHAKAGKIIWQSSFHIGHRHAARVTAGRAALAGDAAHIHSPVAARGMNLGIEDAFVFADCAADALQGQTGRLADYGRLRQRVHKRVVAHVKLLTELARGQPHVLAILRRFLLPAATKFPPAADAMARLVTGLDHEILIN